MGPTRSIEFLSPTLRSRFVRHRFGPVERKSRILHNRCSMESSFQSVPHQCLGERGFLPLMPVNRKFLTSGSLDAHDP
jgi:hypothetical protein